MSIEIYPDADALALAAASKIQAAFERSVGDFHLVLSGGSTPKKLYALLAAEPFASDIDWKRVHVWWGDERFVPSSHPDSNELMARAALLDHVPIPAGNIHAMVQSADPIADASSYEVALQTSLSDRPFDIVLLGIGADAHTASLFPGDPSVQELDRAVLPSEGAAGIKQRITMSAPRLRNANQVLFLVAGADKQPALRHIWGDAYEPSKFPAQLINHDATNVTWMLDAAANPS